jgi:hypothetical protein
VPGRPTGEREDPYDRDVVVPALPAWTGLVVLLAGLAFVGLGLATLRAGRQRARTWRTVRGRVVASRLDDGQVRSQVAFHHDGREIRFWNRYSSTVVSDPVGREVQVLVDPADPSRAVVSRGLSGPGTTGLAFAAFGVLATVVGLVLVL